eukprot:scaffold4705_cov108-Cylindrotheca_fusiformis.AAC.7
MAKGNAWTLILIVLVVGVSLFCDAQELPFLHFSGKLLNDLGEPVSGAHVQFWQTDVNGNYNHPAERSVTLFPDFQYFGTSSSSDDGSFTFMTRRPGIYPSRPVTHIHFKVWVNGSDVLTSQFYFADEDTQYPDSLILELEEVVMDGGSVTSIPTFATNKTIVVDLGFGGDFGPVTPAQPAGPFYPVVDFFQFDSNMVNVTAWETTSAPDLSDSPVTPAEDASVSPTASPATDSSVSPTAKPTTEYSVSPTASFGIDGAGASSSSLVDVRGTLNSVSVLTLLVSLRYY